jgi:hypothetical protein
MSVWVEFLLEVEEMRGYQKKFFKMAANNKGRKLLMAKAKLCEMKVDQLVLSMKETCKQKGIELKHQESNEPATK